jgi:two-component system, chemotaxis family, protein-glutamate methylesterase/glutaminase
VPLRHAVIVVGASAGGVEALLALAGGLPSDLAAAVFVVLHTTAQPSTLPEILARVCPIPVVPVADGAAIQRGSLYVGPAGHHLLVSREHMHVVEGPRENGFRPAIDPLFRSASRAYGPGAIGVILSGMLDDGTAGLLAVKAHGGIAIVQDPDEALAPSMPRSALAYVAVDYTVASAEMGPLLGRLAVARIGEAEEETDMVTLPPFSDDGPLDVVGEAEGQPTRFSCPECSGVLSELHEGTLLRFRCQIGHGYSPKSLVAHQTITTQRALSHALTVVNERGLLLRRLAHEAADRHDHLATRRFETQARAAETQYGKMRDLLETTDANLDDMDEEARTATR